MCFSPEVSFASAAVLVPTGVYCLRTAARRAPRLWPLAVTPCVFGVQQAWEGLVWLGLNSGDEPLTSAAGRVYLFFALAFWPFWFSAGTALIETDPVRRRWLTVCAVLSTVWFWYVYLPVLTTPDGAASRVDHHSIRYAHPDAGGGIPFGPWGFRVAYLVTAAVPVLVSSSKRLLLPILALAFVTAGVAVLLNDHTFVSVWCLFAAVLSVVIVYTIRTAGLTPVGAAGQ